MHSVSSINLVCSFVSFHSSLSVLMLISSFADFFQTFSCPGSSSLVWGVETEPEGGHESDEDLKERENKPFQVQKEKLVGGWSSLLGDKAQIPDILPHSGAPVCVCVEWNQLEIQQSTLQSFLNLRSPCCFPCSSGQVIYGRNRFLAPPFIYILHF